MGQLVCCCCYKCCTNVPHAIFIIFHHRFTLQQNIFMIHCTASVCKRIFNFNKRVANGRIIFVPFSKGVRCIIITIIQIDRHRESHNISQSIYQVQPSANNFLFALNRNYNNSITKLFAVFLSIKYRERIGFVNIHNSLRLHTFRGCILFSSFFFLFARVAFFFCSS